MEVESLRMDLEYVTQRRGLPEGGSLVDVLKRLDEAASSPELPERLEHYLRKRSYVKALAWLDNPATPHQV